jgi:hypothetical protein
LSVTHEEVYPGDADAGDDAEEDLWWSQSLCD